MCDESCNSVVLFTEEVLYVAESCMITVFGLVDPGLEFLCFAIRLILRFGASDAF